MSTRDSTPWASPSAQAIPINAFRSRTGSTSSSDAGYFSSSVSSTRSTQHYACAYPSWPSGGGFAGQARRPPTSYVSDDDLFGLDASPRLREAPAPPRTAQAWLNGAAQHQGNPAVAVAAQRAQMAAAAAQPAADWRRKSIVPKKTVTRTKSSSSSSSASSAGSKN